MTAVAADFYDRVMAAEGSLAMEPLDDSPWLPVYEAAASLLSPSLPVVDLGCGTGRFAELLGRRGQRSYFGYDFAPDVIAEAARYCTTYQFEVADIRDWQHGKDLPDESCYVLLEVLEHLDDDRDALSRVPPGLPVVLSLPNFWSESHVRRFLQPRDVFERYGDLVDFDAWLSLSFPTIMGRRIHVFRGVTTGGRL